MIALVVIDLQKGIVARQTAPHSSADVVARSAQLANRCREIGAPVVLVHVAFAADRSDALKQQVDSPQPPAQLPPDWSDFVPEIGPRAGDIIITKRQWGAFYGTDLDLQLRRRGVRTIVLCGIATNFGVESTARDAWERNYEILFAEDAMTSMEAESHNFAIKKIFPRLGRVRSTAEGTCIKSVAFACSGRHMVHNIGTDQREIGSCHATGESLPSLYLRSPSAPLWPRCRSAIGSRQLNSRPKQRWLRRHPSSCRRPNLRAPCRR